MNVKRTIREFIVSLYTRTNTWVVPEEFYTVADNEQYQEARDILSKVRGWKENDPEYQFASGMLHYLGSKYES